MGRRSRAALSRVSNLRHAQKNLPAHVEDISDPQNLYFDRNPPEEGFFMLEEDLGSDSDSEIEDEENKDESTDKIASLTDADIVAFTRRLAEAQLAAVKAEQITMTEKPNRKRRYTGNSERTKRYHAQKRRKLGETGQQFIQSFFKNKTAIESMPDSGSGEIDSEDEVLPVGASEDEDDEAAVEIVADSGEDHLRRLFPEDDEIKVSHGISRQL